MMKQQFTQDIEQSFLKSKQFTDPKYVRGVFILFTLLYGLFGIIDLVYFPEIIYRLLIIRFVIVIPVLSFTIYLTFSNLFYKLNQPVIAASFLLGGIGVVYMLLLKPENIVYYGGLFMVIFSGYLLIKLRFIYATTTGLLILLSYIIGYFVMYGSWNNLFLYSTLFFIGANLIGMVGAYSHEKMIRKQFLDMLKISEINTSLQEQFDEKIKQFNQLERSIEENEQLKKLNHEKDMLAQSLKDSEEQYRLLTTQMQLGLALHEVIFDDEGHPIDYRFLSVNDSFEQLTGLKREGLIGKTVLSVLPETEKYWIETFGMVAKTGKAIQFENYTQALNRYYTTSAYAPKLGQFAVIIDDITDRKKQEVERMQREKDLLTSQKIAHLGTWRLNIQTNEVTWSEELYHMYGFDPKLPPPPYTEHMKLFTKPSWDKLSKALAKTRHIGTPYELELQMINHDGSLGWMWVKGEAERDENGDIVSISGAAQDITERKRLEEELNESHQKFIAIFEKSPVAIEFYDAQGFHSYANEAANELFGVINSDELRKENLFNNPNLTQDLIQKIKNLEQVHLEIEYDFDRVKEFNVYQTTKSGKIILNLSITPLIINEKLNGYILHSEDITIERREQKEIEYLGYHDYLTNLYNRRYFVSAYDDFVKRKCFPMGLMMIDMNGLKIINDAFGHAKGDEAIKSVSKILLQVFDEHHVVARIGGDEFAILTPHKDFLDLQKYKEDIIEKAKGFSVGNIELSLAIGYEVITDADKDIDDLLSTAENYLYRHKVAVGSSVRNRAIKAILNTLSDKYEDEKIHSKRVSIICKKMGNHLGLSKDEVNLLELAGMYHDIGKISIPDAILNKPGKLTTEEFEIIKTHTMIGYQILKAADEYSGLAEYALSHHERWDGKGYPKGLSGNEIPFFSRIISIADAFEAMTADRPYRKGMNLEDAIAEIKRCSGSQFDPHLAKLFIEYALYEES